MYQVIFFSRLPGNAVSFEGSDIVSPSDISAMFNTFRGMAPIAVGDRPTLPYADQPDAMYSVPGGLHSSDDVIVALFKLSVAA